MQVDMKIPTTLNYSNQLKKEEKFQRGIKNYEGPS